MVGKIPPKGRQKKQTVRKSGQRSVSSLRWLNRQINDPYVAEAQAMGYRSRAVFKLMQLDEKLHILKPGAKIIDLGAAPGGWTQLAVEKIKPEKSGGKVIALDILEMVPIPGAVILHKDFTEPDACDILMSALDGKADAVISDMAANTVGHHRTDHLRIMALAESAYDFARQVLSPGGTFLCKLFQGGAEGDLLTLLKRDFTSVKHIKPPASRKDSSETYLVAVGFKGSDSLS